MSDPIVDEVHLVREQIWQKCDGRIEQFVARLRALQSKYADRIVTKESISESRSKAEVRV
jgi:hypothetical protein